MQKILIFGNSGSGKTTMAKQLATSHGIPHFDLDTCAWNEPGVRKSLKESQKVIDKFVAEHSSWVIEGSYGSLVELVLEHCNELRFLNPGIEKCLQNCDSRPWEPEKYPTPEAQNQNLEMLKNWVRDYEIREDEYSYREHQRIFERYLGKKQEYR
ncbi:MAG: AAA family ATPase [Cyanobacteriota bacterium]|nr:AAA family ATPase [Cyanobacteriota bacterium]